MAYERQFKKDTNTPRFAGRFMTKARVNDYFKRAAVGEAILTNKTDDQKQKKTLPGPPQKPPIGRRMHVLFGYSDR